MPGGGQKGDETKVYRVSGWRGSGAPTIPLPPIHAPLHVHLWASQEASGRSAACARVSCPVACILPHPWHRPNIALKGGKLAALLACYLLVAKQVAPPGFGPGFPDPELGTLKDAGVSRCSARPSASVIPASYLTLLKSISALCGTTHAEGGQCPAIGEAGPNVWPLSIADQVSPMQ
jgi:hypothetical protein